ncbi:FAD:protein FMN transferase [Aeromicrobium sp. CFBP 8757]|uniref:FAD:protein FMN transferase n=1 Tax=Aeromicrobium sp. CFBP 8757 TaxID=2775288 RepID=UPI00177EAD4F|nr:FAD:protein FMN transferase [Aeromicrobium sp. CFBP 8757]MBD8607625.1 FAD:protein FMN transferase [Aeromicrobium sp. CFBP 8757]
MTASAIWTDWSCRVRVTVTRPDALMAAKQQVVALMADVALSADRFTATSDVSRVNRAAGRLVPVRRRTMELLDVALAAAEESGGAVDPTIGAHLLRAGYADDITAVRDLLVMTDDEPLPRADWTSVRTDRTLSLVGLPTDVSLDLGATAKAWTADVAARRVARSLDTAVLVEIGGDVAIAGSRSRPWQVQVSERSGEPGQPVGLERGGLATSSTISRRWRTPSGAAHHVIDPRTGRPAEGPWRTVTVWAPTAVRANTASTAALVLGDDAVPHLHSLDVAARLVGRDGTVQHVGDWPAETRAA